MAIATDISIAANGDIRYTGTTANYTVIELHRFLGDLADDVSSSGDDLIDITSDTPSDRSTDNIITLFSPYNIDDTLATHLYDGSIIQLGGDTIYDGIVNFGRQGIYIDVIQNGGLVTPNFWTTGLNADSAQGISHRFLVKVRDAGVDIDGRRLTGIAREFGNTYSEFGINGTSRGNNVLALTDSTDLNNANSEATVAAWSGITNVEGYRGIDVDNNGTNEFYYSEWTRGTHSINDFYEKMKWMTRRGTSETMYGISGAIFRGITHEIDVDTPSGTFTAPEPLSWATGTGQLLAINSPTAATKLWIQILTGIAPVDGQTLTGGASAASVDVNVNVVDRTVSFPFVGASTGSSLIGAYGFGMVATDLTANDKLFDLTNTQNVPPNYVTFSVGGLITGEDNVLVTPELTGGIDKSQLVLSGALAGGEAVVNVTTAIPTDTPSSGTIRIFNGVSFSRVTYSSWTGSAFSGCVGVPSAADAADVFITYIDVVASGATEQFTSVYLADRSLFIRVRDGGATPIKTFETTGTLGSAGGSSTAIRTSDE